MLKKALSEQQVLCVKVEQQVLPKKLLSIPRARMLHPSSIGIKKSPKIEKNKILTEETTYEKSISSNEGTCEPKTVFSDPAVKPTQSNVLICAPSEMRDRYDKVLKFL